MVAIAYGDNGFAFPQSVHELGGAQNTKLPSRTDAPTVSAAVRTVCWRTAVDAESPHREYVTVRRTSAAADTARNKRDIGEGCAI